MIATTIATRTTLTPATPMARMIEASKTSRPASAIATVRPEKRTVRPAVATVRSVARATSSRVGTSCSRCASSSRKRLTVSRP